MAIFDWLDNGVTVTVIVRVGIISSPTINIGSYSFWMPLDARLLLLFLLLFF